MTDSQKFAVLVVSPENYTHNRAFDEIAETLQAGFQSLGWDCPITNIPVEGRRHIVLGSNLIFTQRENRYAIPPDSILYNLEQIDFSSPWFNASMLLHFKNYTLWDYSKTNLEALERYGISDAQHLPVGYAQPLTRILEGSTSSQDIDILFYGSLNERRQNILHALEQGGLKVKTLFGVYGSERDEWISRSKIVLNLHHYHSQVFEIVRVSYLLANKKFVISELGTIDETTDFYQPGLVFARYENLVQTCLDYLQKPEQERNAIAQIGFELIQSRPIEKFLQPLVEALPEAIGTHPLQTMLRVDLGCGGRKAKGYFGVDICPAPGVDLVANLNYAFPFEDSVVDELRAHDVIEHLPDRIHTMNEIWRICKPGALVDLLVPSSDGRGAFQDPTHVSFWNINSFQYFTVEYPGYLELCQQYGFKGAFRLIALKEYESPDRVIHVHAVLEVIKNEHLQRPLQESIASQLRLNNLILLPDWSRSEEDLFSALRACFQKLLTLKNLHQTTVLLDTSQSFENRASEPEGIIESCFMDLMLSDGLEIEEGEPHIVLMSLSDYVEWEDIKPRLTARLICEADNTRIVSTLRLEQCPVLTL